MQKFTGRHLVFLFITQLGFIPAFAQDNQAKLGENELNKTERKSFDFWLSPEIGWVKQARNVVRIPADTGTEFSLVPFNEDFNFVYRLYVGLSFAQRHEFRALYAPFKLTGEKIIDSDITYQDQIYLKGSKLKGTYQFNSYRLTYRYTWLSDDNYSFKLGFTGKIRDAFVKLDKVGNESAIRSNVGFVPLLNASFNYKLLESESFIKSIWFETDVDALAAPQGRAEDLALVLSGNINESLKVKFGYRTVEGGAKNGGNVYTFAWLNYIITSMEYHF